MNQSSHIHIEHSIVLVDGVCHFCQGATRFIIKRDPKGIFHFGSLQSEAGQELLRAGGLSTDQLDTFVLIEDGTYYTRSTAALRIAKRLRFPYPLAYVFILIPRFVRNAVYNWVARNRYRWFGKDEEDQCQIPPPEIRQRFF
ncbi:thiol-disulfide oxidoreductase DCC family protein [Paenibacillus polymyxa]|uniref:thiol-disulfide oxidoreductase DCC family protein n=1 Tax=Paenibacillus TaxID=44249 RepID=UPI00042F47C0|nr:thiol-disulfide oxidoreductase DCC family protein [Paenibacillus polymyxa]MEB4781226.1 thiol-disulfide oxidoreductase DCC family protein [Paenibacillus jamilae]AHM64973.1 thiol-disulfide oxidoreductase dcc [Paenibacillus polymyxa SQR-21]AIY10570.1 thiol-disulfide oxidoreductase DCC [Paenibacillus polymyxa]MEE4561810.1 thiol-disulfide oxidoreductase DCC family protein [Paenibacillus polymyxa]QDA29991.1 thiol-disulfide oxidoreductase DCC family protein [Paenibacillus polymyxa]